MHFLRGMHPSSHLTTLESITRHEGLSVRRLVGQSIRRPARRHVGTSARRLVGTPARRARSPPNSTLFPDKVRQRVSRFGLAVVRPDDGDDDRRLEPDLLRVVAALRPFALLEARRPSPTLVSAAQRRTVRRFPFTVTT